jgi:hypothetical protein
MLLDNIAHTLDIYGPGYISNEVLKKGIECFYNKNGPYDIVVTNEHTLYANKGGWDKDFNKAYSDNHFLSFDSSLLKSAIYDMHNFYMRLSTYDVKKVAFLLESDYYSMDQVRIENIINSDSYIAGFGYEFIKYKEELEDIKKESFSEKVNDKYKSFIKKYSEKVISTVHFIDNSEIHYNTLDDRKYLVNVLGTNYYRRKIVNSILEKNKIAKYNNFHIFMYKFFNNIGCNPYSNYTMLKLYNIFFNKLLIDSKSIYTDGSALNLPIRKYFEIPASGSLLIATPCNGFDKLGFNNENSIVLDNFNDIIDIINSIKSSDHYQKIATRGNKLIYNNHSIFARVKQLNEAFELIVNNSYHGSSWTNGQVKYDSVKM